MPGKRAWLACSLLLAVAACTSRRPISSFPAERADLAVVSWNLHEGRGDLRRFIDALASGTLTGAPPADYVLLLQEAVAPDLEDIAAQRGLHAFHLPVFSGRPRPRGTAIVATRPLSMTRAIDLPEERQHRVTAAAAIEVAGEQLVVVSAHLENRLGLLRGGPFGDRARGRQAQALVDALPRDGHAIVGGDMNTMLGPGEPAWRILAERFADTPAEQSPPTFRDRLVLDHLFFDLPQGWRVARRVLPGRYGSDHHPVLAVITGAAAAARAPANAANG